jgi:phosphoglycerol transferase MdoB-like AlkP superfamily enzyme
MRVVSALLDRACRQRYGGVLVFALLFLGISFLTRLALLLKTGSAVDHGLGPLAGAFAVGLFFDLVTLSYAVIPLVLYVMLLPEFLRRRRFQRWLATGFCGVAVFVLLFISASEWFFWDEFGVRFNFIAVDYLVYTNEVIGNIRQSYPLPLIIGGLLGVTVAIVLPLARRGYLTLWLGAEMPRQRRLLVGALILLAPLLSFVAVDSRLLPEFRNVYNRELAQNGQYAFCAAFLNNSLSYEGFYETVEPRQAFAAARKLIATDNATFLSEDPLDLSRQINGSGPEKRWNVIQITIESLSASYIGALAPGKKSLTPKLDRLIGESIAFTNLYATGTRTVRGMEALSLSVPPTPGHSMVRRPDNENLFSLGSLFQARGYDTTFLYSGFGYFDNMNYFFSHNGFRVVDRASQPSDAVTFANIWGACDEDLYRWAMAEADRSYAAGKPFFHFVMTTSNHRPYTFPAGKVDCPQGERSSAVRYTDYAIADFIERARTKPWFANTVFVIVADHCANSAGKTELPLPKYRIPLILYNPELFGPRRVDTLCSQMDYAPTLLGLLNWTYKSRFFGRDVLRLDAADGRALPGSYQTLGYLRDGLLVTLKPVRRHSAYHITPRTLEATPCDTPSDRLSEAIAYYQTAGYLLDRHLYGRLDAP